MLLQLISDIQQSLRINEIFFRLLVAQKCKSGSALSYYYYLINLSYTQLTPPDPTRRNSFVASQLRRRCGSGINVVVYRSCIAAEEETIRKMFVSSVEILVV